jgi:hypothetical protein
MNIAILKSPYVCSIILFCASRNTIFLFSEQKEKKTSHPFVAGAGATNAARV